MVTKDQLALLRRSFQQKKEMHLTIGGNIETAVHSQSTRKRMAEYRHGQKRMNMAVSQFRQQMRLNVEGHLQNRERRNFPKEIAKADKATAEKARQENQLDYNEGKLEKSQRNYRASMKQAFSPRELSR